MGGLIIIFVILIWVTGLMFFIELITRKFADKWWRLVVATPIFFVLLLLPIADEIIGKRQFEKMCEEQSKVVVDVVMAKGRIVQFDRSPLKYPRDTAIPITILPKRYVDVETGELVFHYNIVTASGGFLSRFLSLTEDPQPFIFTAFCRPDNQVDQLERLGLISREKKK
ncbi:hypothetical protein H8L32_19455 [Undibacterium sp. CY18W]|uniref:Uncharacterized protein n=1 Tax=Undibacterium hunanense TaxID=2762292 RepID=A0ABR6ZUV5_9BURK|nr:hypothetical protein [Undibacterium hunanense]MBC3919662.1 hypothetical protein [Undibacterium hunanense]